VLTTVKEQFSRLRKYVIGLTWLFSIFETFCGITFGALLGAQLSGSTTYAKFVWPLVIIYGVLLVMKIWGQKLCPPALVEELNAKVTLHDAQAEVARKETIDGYVAHAIRALNNRTCAITDQTQTNICDTTVEDGLREVLDPLINTPQYVLDCNRSRFTIIAVVRHGKINTTENTPQHDWSPSALCFRDDLGLGQFINQDIFDNLDVTGSQLQIQTLLRIAFNDQRLSSGIVTIDEHSYSIVCAPIPVVCESANSNGAFSSPMKDVANCRRTWKTSF